MSNWEEIEKQVKEYGEHSRWHSRKEANDCLANIKGIVEAMESQIPKECSHGVSMQEPCEKCDLKPIQQIDKDVCDYIAASSSYDMAQRQNERIAQLSERIEKLEDAVEKTLASTTQLDLNQRFLEFMAKCEENGKKREERIKSLEGFRLKSLQQL